MERCLASVSISYCSRICYSHICNPLKMKNNWNVILFMLRSTHSHGYGNNLSYTLLVELRISDC